jgi:hypothetical protein
MSPEIDDARRFAKIHQDVRRTDRDELNERDLYPESVDVGVSASLQAELDRLGSDLTASWPHPLALWSSVERGARSAEVSAAADERAFVLALWADGIVHFSGSSAELATVAEAIRDWLSAEEPGIDALAVKFPWLVDQPLARAYERGEATEYLWRSLLDAPPTENLRPLIDAAAADPRLRPLYPSTSFDRLCFSRTPGGPSPDAFPYAAPREGCFRVWRANKDGYLNENREFVLGEGDATRAVELLVEALPR